MFSTVWAILAGFITFVLSAWRIFAFISGNKSERLKHAEEKAERLAHRPRTTSDVVERLRRWREQQD